jgi:hypothetical protein
MLKSARVALIALSVCLVVLTLWSPPPLPPLVNGVGHVSGFDDVVVDRRHLPQHRREERDASDDGTEEDGMESTNVVAKPVNTEAIAAGRRVDSPRGPSATYEPLPVDAVNSESGGDAKLLSSQSFANGAANRSPHRDPSPLRLPKQAAVALTASDIECWGISGEGAAVHGWAVPLFTAIAPHWDTFVDATTKDAWAALVVWAPTRFMPPQAPGRKANGQVQEAPTRGKDPKYYLRTYNATWHMAFAAGGLDYVAQLSHRNALAVCVRERLHINLLRCGVSVGRGAQEGTEGVLPVYYCPCRHCNDKVLRKTRTQRKALSLTAESKKWVPKTSVYDDVEKALQQRRDATNSCVDGTAAPWLISRNHLASLPYEGKHNDLDALLKVQADANNVVVMSILNVFWIDHLHNEVFSAVHNAGITNYIIATMDAASLLLCRSNRLPCYDAEHLAEFEEDVGKLGHRAGTTRKVTESMSWIKPRLALAVLERGYGFVMCDLDMSWVKNPMKDVLSANVDVAHQCDNKNKFSINSGYYFARPNPRTVQFFRNLMLFTPEETPDQTAMKLMSRYDHTHGASHACLDQWAFNMKCNYKQEKTKRGKGEAMTYEWLPFDRNRKKFFFRMLHATCLSGALNKIKYLRTMNAWYLDDLDKMTHTDSNNREYCLRLPDGTEVKSKLRTIHSPGYTLDEDRTYLKTRH